VKLITPDVIPAAKGNGAITHPSAAGSIAVLPDGVVIVSSNVGRSNLKFSPRKYKGLPSLVIL
jgi:hypothetical protein